MIRVLEFPFEPTAEQEKTLKTWQVGLTKFWNFVLGQMKRLDEGFVWDKASKQFYPACRIPHCSSLVDSRMIKNFPTVPHATLYIPIPMRDSVNLHPKTRCGF
ncbi:MAG: hypothetical protein F6K03_13260 [Kamptonema sp. SIO4C4]|nr:hypothetical protein [Kamptonema sp. SIO4C4]